MENPVSETARDSRMGQGGGDAGQPAVGRQQQQGEGGGAAPHVEVGIEGGTTDDSRNVDVTNLDKAVDEVGTSSSINGPSPQTRGREVAIRIDEEKSSRSGADGGETLLQEGDASRQKEADDRSLDEGLATAAAAGTPAAGTTAAAGAEARARAAADATDAQQFRSSAPFILPTRFPLIRDKSGEHFIDIPLRTSSKGEELDAYKRFGIPRTLSNFSRASMESGGGEQCRICQQHSDEPLMELGCECRGELARAHKSCVDHWFGNKGTNKCEVCQHVATNVPPPSCQPTPHFWVWRVGGPYNSTARRGGGVGPYRLNPLPMRPVLLMILRRHPIILLLWLLLFAFMAYLFVDVTKSTSIGYAAMPIGFLFGVLVVLGLGTAARLVLECWHERVIRRNIQRMEEEPNFEDFPPEPVNNIEAPAAPVEGAADSNGPTEPSPGTAEEQSAAQQGAAEASVTASVPATAAPDVENR